MEVVLAAARKVNNYYQTPKNKEAEEDTKYSKTKNKATEIHQ